MEGLCYLLEVIGDYLTCGRTRGKFSNQLQKSSNGRDFLNERLGCISLGPHHSFGSWPPMLILVPITKALGSDRVANSSVPLKGSKLCLFRLYRKKLCMLPGSVRLFRVIAFLALAIYALEI